MTYVEYNSNNSGGSWWLRDEDWKHLEEAGWEVQWGRPYFCHSRFSETPKPSWLTEECKMSKRNGQDWNPCPGHYEAHSYEEAIQSGERWLGALAKSAIRRGLKLRKAVDDWESITGESATAAGCPCCGQPHYFTEYSDEGDHIASGPSVHYEARWDYD